jgi:hypothetical protein
MMIPPKGRVNPKIKSVKIMPEPLKRRIPMAKAAIVEITSDTGTTASTMKVLDPRSAAIFATLNASIKLPHCGSEGHSRPFGMVFEGYSAVMNILIKGNTVNAINVNKKSLPTNNSLFDGFISMSPGLTAELAE